MLGVIRRARKAAEVPVGRTESARAFNRARELAKIADLQRDLARMRDEANQIIERQVGAHARQGTRRADKLARDAGLVRDDAPILGALTGAESARAAVISRSKQHDLGKALGSISAPNGIVGRAIRKSNALGLDQAKLRRVLAGGALDGVPAAALKAVRDLYAKLGDGKVIEVVNKHGVVMTFEVDHYAGLVYRTAMAEATNTAEIERLVARQAYYVKIIGSNSVHFCTAYVGKVYYIGPGEDPLGHFPRIDTLPRGGAPFHPNCSKRYVPFNPATATPAQVDAAKPTPETKRLAGIDEAEAQQRFAVQQAAKPKPTEAPSSAAAPTSVTDDEPVTVIKKTGPIVGEIIPPPAEPLIRVTRPAVVSGRSPVVALVDAAGRPIVQVDVDRPSTVESIVRVVDRVRARGLPVPPLFNDAPEIFEETYPGYSDSVAAAYVGDEVDINSRSPLWKNMPAVIVEQHRIGRWSSADPDHTLLNEAAHHVHRVALGNFSRFQAYSRVQLPPSMIASIATEVSSYALIDAQEFVAETLAALLAGRSFSQPIMKLYYSYGGVW